MRVVPFVAFLALLVVAASAQSSRTGFQTVVNDLASFQTSSGGFSPLIGEQATLSATANGAFLASVYGLLNKVDINGVSSYLQTLKVENGLYTAKAGTPVTTESLRDGLLVATYTGVNIEKSVVEAFLRSLYDSETKMFAPRVGGIPSPKATAEALEILSLAGITGRDWPAKVLAEIKAFLPTILSNGAFVFPATETGAVALSDRELFENNVNAIVAANVAGVEFTNVAELVQYFTERLPARGGFAFSPREAPVFEATYGAVRALRALERSTGQAIIESLPNRESIMQGVWFVPADLTKTGPAHQAFARLPNMKDAFGVSVSLDTPGANRVDETNPNIVAGTPVAPFVHVVPWGVQPHSGVNVEVVLSHKSGSDKKYKLLWNEERMGFTTEESFPTDSKLGDLTATAFVRVPIAGDVITIKSRVKFNIGYVMNVKPVAKVAGREIQVGGAVTVGTEFSFDASLSTTSALVTGAFDLVFSVLDSSDVLISESRKNFNKDGAESVHFSFELKQANLPAGALTFKFHVLDHATNTIHTAQTFTYELQLAMVASQIKIGNGASFKPTFKLGEEATVSFVPASFPDLVNLHTYSAVDAAGEETTERRAFYLDTMDAGAVLRSFAGIASADAQGNVQITFSVTFPATFDAIGTHNLRFRYSPVKGGDVILSNYDSAASELLDENVEVGFEVSADLYITNLVDAPKGGSLSYGDLVRFSFKIKDRITGESVSAAYGANAASPIFLTLAHKDTAGKSYVSARHAIVADPRGGFEAEWVVNPNAISGKGTLQLVAVVLGGREIALPTEDGKTFGVNVVIGGEISHTAVVKQVSIPTATHASALVEFTLTCQERRLSGALLTASLIQNGQVISTFPVSRSDNEAVYTVAWNIREADAASASYEVAIRRQADASGAPLVTIPVSFAGATTHYLPFRTEAVVLTLAFAAFAYFSYRKYLIERK